MYSLRQLAKHGLVSAVLVFGIGAGASFADHHGPSYDDITLGGQIRARYNYFDLDNAGDLSFAEQRTELSAHAAFSHNVAAHMTLHSYRNWGNDFERVSIGDGFASTGDVNFYEGYFDVGSDLRLRVGRQELVFGNEWLLGNNNSNALFAGQSYDGVRLTYATGGINFDAFYTTLVEGFGDGFAKEDVNLIGTYFSYSWCEDSSADAYFLWLRDDNGAYAGVAGSNTDLYTIGGRVGAVAGGLDYEAELAYQFGDIDFGAGNKTDFGGLGLNAEIGYTFDAAIAPRVFFNYAYMRGDRRDKIGFQRLFSDVEYSMFDPGANLTNIHALILGGSLKPAERFTTGLDLKYFLVQKDVQDDDLGFEIHLHADYAYTDFLNFRAGWAWFDAGKAIEQGNNTGGTLISSGSRSDNYNYLYVESTLHF